MVNRVAIYECININIERSDTIERLEGCERLINNASRLIQTPFLQDLANKVLLKKCQLLTQQYPIYE